MSVMTVIGIKEDVTFESEDWPKTGRHDIVTSVRMNPALIELTFNNSMLINWYLRTSVRWHIN